MSRFLFAAALVAVSLSACTVHAQAPESGPDLVPQRPSFERYTTADGLPGNILRGVAQDSLGYIWVGGVGGVARFDGTTFEQIQLADVPTYDANLSNIFTVYADPQGTVWVGGFEEGLQRFDQRTQRFVAYVPDSSDATQLFGPVVPAVLTDRGGRTWVSSVHPSADRGLVQWLDPETGTFEPFAGRTPADTLGRFPSALLEDMDGMIWIADYRGAGLQRYDPETGTVSRFLYDPNDPATIHGDRLFRLYQDRDGYLWVGGGDYFGQADAGGLSRFDPETETFLRFYDGERGFGGRSVISIAEDPDGVLWVGTTPGALLRYDRATETFSTLDTDLTDPHSYGSATPHAMLSDDGDTFWIATWGEGLRRRDATAGRFQHFGVRARDPDTYGLSDVMSVLRDRTGDVWIGSWGEGLLRYDPDTDTYTRYAPNPADPRALTSGFVRTLYEDRRGSLWVGTFFGGLHRYDRTTDSFTRYVPIEGDTTSLDVPSVRAMYEDEAGRFWVGLWGGGRGNRGGLALMDRDQGTFTTYRPIDGDSTSIPNRQVTRIAEDGNGRLWVTFNGDLPTYLDREAGTFTTLSDSQQVFGDFVHVDRQGRVWFGGFNGLIHYDPDTGAVERYTEEDGLLESRINSILEDADGHLWLAHYHGLTRFNPATKATRTFDRTQGVPVRQFTNSSIYQDASGLLFFGGEGGVMAFHPDDLARNTVEPPVVLTQLRLSNEPVTVGEDGPLTESLTTIETLRLAHDENDVGFTFAALHFLNAAHNRYTYRLDGHDENWIDAGTQQTATYTNLAPGRYTFRVKAANADGVWNETGVALPVVVRSPWWATPWAYLLYAGLLGGLLLVGFRTQRQRIEAQERERRRVLEARQRELEATVAERTAEIQQRAEELAVINSVQEGLVAELEMQGIYDLVGDRLQELFDAQVVVIRTFDRDADTEHLHYAVEKGVRYPFPDPRPADGFVRHMMTLREPLRVNANFADYVRRFEDSEAAAAGEVPQSALFVPMIVGGVVRGNVSLQNVDNEGAFSDEDQRLLTTLTNSMSVALENARLFGESRQQAVELDTVNRISRALNRQLDFDALVHLVGERMRETFGADVVYVALHDQSAGLIRFPYAFGEDFEPLTYGEGLTSQILRTHEPLLLNRDVQAETERLGIEQVGKRSASYLGVPIIAGDAALGVISVQTLHEENRFDETDLRLLNTIAANVGVALQNADAYGRLNATLEELTRTQQQLVQQEKLASLGQLTAGIAHEIKNPLNFINNFAEVNQELAGDLREALAALFNGSAGDGGPSVSDEVLSNEVGTLLDDIERTAGVIADHGKRADGIVRSMMQHAHGGQGQRQEVDLNALVAEHVALAYHGKRAQIPDFSVSVEKHLGADVGTVEVIPQEIGRVIVNLVGNAFDALAGASPALSGGDGESMGPRVFITTERHGHTVEIRVADNGPGIPDALRARVFEPFFTTKPTGSGTGLGLSMSYDIVTQGHGGTLTVEDAPGGGAVFTVALPALPLPSASDASAPPMPH